MEGKRSGLSGPGDGIRVGGGGASRVTGIPTRARRSITGLGEASGGRLGRVDQTAEDRMDGKSGPDKNAPIQARTHRKTVPIR